MRLLGVIRKIISANRGDGNTVLAGKAYEEDERRRVAERREAEVPPLLIVPRA